MYSFGYQPRHTVDIKDREEYNDFLLHKPMMNQYLTHRLFEVKPPIVEKPKKKSNKK